MNYPTRLEKIADLLLEISSILMVSGANTTRANLSINRFASALNCEASSLISHKTIVLTLTDKETGLSFTKVQNIPSYAVNFSAISSMSSASWNAIYENWNIERIEAEVESIKKEKRYSRIVVLVAVSFAGAGFCNIFGGDYLNMIVAFTSTFIGLVFFQETSKKRYNMYIRVFLASFIASTLASICVVYNIGENPQTALATSTLFLIPGVALINSFTDFMDNNVLNGMVRFSNGLMTVLVLSLGLFLAMIIFHINLI